MVCIQNAGSGHASRQSFARLHRKTGKTCWINKAAVTQAPANIARAYNQSQNNANNALENVVKLYCFYTFPLESVIKVPSYRRLSNVKSCEKRWSGVAVRAILYCDYYSHFLLNTLNTYYCTLALRCKHLEAIKSTSCQRTVSLQLKFNVSTSMYSNVCRISKVPFYYSFGRVALFVL